MKTKVFLCGEKSCCPAVEVNGDEVRIGETGNICVLRKDEWNIMVEKIKSGELDSV